MNRSLLGRVFLLDIRPHLVAQLKLNDFRLGRVRRRT